MKKSSLVIFGLKDLAELAYEYFTHDSDFNVVAFTVNEAYMQNNTHYGLPVVPFEQIERFYSPEKHHFFAALSYQQLNRSREKKYLEFKAKGYAPASYISSHTFKWHNVEVGEHCFIFEDNTLQPFVKIGNNVVLWSGNHIGHSSIIHDNVFITSHVVVSGFCEIGKNSFLGVNSTLANDTKIGQNCWISHASVISGQVPDHKLVKNHKSEIIDLNEERLFGKLTTISKERS